MAEIYYCEYVLIPYPADLKDRPSVSLRHETAIDETPTGREKRRSRRAVLRRILRWTLTAKDGEWAGRMEETFRIAQENKKACVPRFLSARRIAAIEGTTITLDAVADVDFPAGSTIWWSTPDASAYGLAIVTASTSATVTVSAIAEGMAVGAYISPIALGFIEASPTVKEISGGARRFTLSFAQSMGDLNGSFRTLDPESASLGVSISGELVEVSPNRECSEPQALAVSISGSLVTVVVSASDSDAAALGVSLSGSIQVVAFNTNTSEPSSLGVTISGTLA